MADMTELKNAIRIGTVQSVSAEKMTARVKFKDKGGITSGDLHIIKRPVYVIPAMESGTEGQTAKTELQYDYGGELKKKVSHYHEAFVSAGCRTSTTWFFVLCFQTVTVTASLWGRCNAWRR